MHSNIVQIEAAPIDTDDMINPELYYDHWFLGAVADYVQEDKTAEDTLNTLRAFLCVCEDLIEFFEDENGSGVIFKEGYVRGYFTRKLKPFSETLTELADNATVENFCNDEIGHLMYRLDMEYDDKYGFYIQHEADLLTLNQFIRRIKPGIKYYFGGTVDYHC